MKSLKVHFSTRGVTSICGLNATSAGPAHVTRKFSPNLDEVTCSVCKMCIRQDLRMPIITLELWLLEAQGAPTMKSAWPDDVRDAAVKVFRTQLEKELRDEHVRLGEMIQELRKKAAQYDVYLA